jgi:hypothetical protein
VRLSAIMSHAGLSAWAIAGLIVFSLVFFSILLRLWLQGRRGELKGRERLPLEDGRLAGSGKDEAGAASHEERP